MAFESNFSISAILAETNSTLAEKIEQQNERNMLASPCISNSSEDSSVTSDKSTAGRPDFTYGALIVMAIRSNVKQRLPLSAIIEWIAGNFPFYEKHKSGWQSSIRHNLSMNRCFVRVPRGLDDPGRGHYWAIDPAAEDVTVGETTGRLRRDQVNRTFSAAGPMRAKTSAQFGSGFGHPYQSEIANHAMAHHYSTNAVYFPTPEEIRLVEHSMLQQHQFDQQAFSYHMQQQQQHPMQQPFQYPV